MSKEVITYNPLNTSLYIFTSKYGNPIVLYDSFSSNYIVYPYDMELKTYKYKRNILNGLQFEKIFMVTLHPDKYHCKLPINTTILVPEIPYYNIPKLRTFKNVCDICKYQTKLYTCDCNPVSYLCYSCHHKCVNNFRPSIHGYSKSKVLYLTHEWPDFEFLYNDIPFYDVVILLEGMDNQYYQKIKLCLPHAIIFSAKQSAYLHNTTFGKLNSII